MAVRKWLYLLWLYLPGRGGDPKTSRIFNPSPILTCLPGRGGDPTRDLLLLYLLWPYILTYYTYYAHQGEEETSPETGEEETLALTLTLTLTRARRRLHPRRSRSTYAASRSTNACTAAVSDMGSDMGSNYCGTHITIAIVSDMGSHSVVGVPTHVRDAAGASIASVVDLDDGSEDDLSYIKLINYGQKVGSK
eukprot:scaffold89261_cov61-Phaeocystis_antarctica.AAC.6